MNVDDKTLMSLAKRVGMSSRPDSKTQAMMDEINQKYMGKSDDQLLKEIMGLKEVIKKDPKVYNQQLEAIKALRPMMNPEQRMKLEALLKMLE